MVIVNTKDILPQEKKSKSVIQSIARTALIPSVVLGNLALKGIEKNIQKNVDPTYTVKYTTTKEAAETTTGKILGSTIAAAAVGLTVASGVAGKALSTPKGKAIGLLTAGAASVSPTVTKAVIETPAALVDTGIKIGESIEGMPTDKTKDLGVGGLLLAGAGGLLAGAGIAAATNAIKDISKGSEGAAGLLGTNDTIENAGVITPQTTTMSKTASKKRKKTRSKALPQQIRQSVRIDINNRNTAHRITKKYIKNTSY